MRRTWLVGLWFVILAAAPVPAQERTASVTMLGGGTLPVGAAGDAMGPAWNVGVAGTVAVGPSLGIRADYLYNRFGDRRETVDVGLGPMLPAFRSVDVRSKSQMHVISLDLTWVRPHGRGRFYLMAGPTYFRRRVQLTAADVQGIASECRAQWLQCAPESIGFDVWQGIKKSNDLGFNAGAGVTLRTGLTAMLTLEARYFYVNGPTFRAADGRSVSSSAHFVPVSIGLTF
jgi:hypothetical protein